MKNCAINIIAVVMSGMLIGVQMPVIGSIIDSGESEEIIVTETTEDEPEIEIPAETEAGPISVPVIPEMETEVPAQDETESVDEPLYPETDMIQQPEDSQIPEETEVEDSGEEETEIEQEDTEEDGIEAYDEASPFPGEGTAESPYLIHSVESLKKLAELVNSGAANVNGTKYRVSHYKLVDRLPETDMQAESSEEAVESVESTEHEGILRFGKIKMKAEVIIKAEPVAEFDLSGIEWTPIGTTQNAFTGVFDGSGMTIKNLTINTSGNWKGLFGYVINGRIKNLTLKGSVTSTGTQVGLLAGYASGTVFENCILSGRVEGSVGDSGTIGPFGTLYKSQNTQIINCDVSGVESYPSNYTTDARRFMAYQKKSTGNLDVIANYNATWIQTTFHYVGYEYAVSGGLTGQNVNVSAEPCSGGRYIRIIYNVTNNSDNAITNGKLAAYADIQIGDNDNAKIEVIREGGRAIGVKMVDTHSTNCASKNAQYNLYFAGTAGVTDVSTYWFGSYSSRQSNCFNQINVDSVENMDTGLAFSWQGIHLQPGESRSYSFILGIGETASAPKWETYPVTLAAEQVGMHLNVTSKVSDAAGVTDILYYHYAPEGSQDYTPETEVGRVETDGVNVQTITGDIDLSDLEDGRYLFQFWLVNDKGVTTASVEKLVIIENGVISGDVENFTELSVKVDDQTPKKLFQVADDQLWDIARNTRTEEDIANDSKIQLTMTITDETASEPDRQQAESVLSGIAASTLGAYYDIILTKTTVTADHPMKIEKIHDTATVVSGSGITINLQIPERMEGGSNYQIIRVHDGVAEPLETVQNGNIISFTSSKFSTYVLAYTPAQTTVSSGSAVSVETPVSPVSPALPADEPGIDRKPGHIVKIETPKEDLEEPDNFEQERIMPVSSRNPVRRGSEPGTGDSFPLEVYATILMITGFCYLYLCFADKIRGMTEETKKKLIVRLVRWAKQGGKIRRILAVAALFFLLAYYHLIGKRIAKTKQESIGNLTDWARQGSRIRKLPAVIALFFLLVYYYTLGGNEQMEFLGQTNQI